MLKKITSLLFVATLCSTPSVAAYLSVGETTELLLAAQQDPQWKLDRVDMAVGSSGVIGPSLCLAGIINLSLGCCLSGNPAVGWGLFGVGCGISTPVYGGLLCRKCHANWAINRNNTEIKYEVSEQQSCSLPQDRLEGCRLRASGVYILNAQSTILKKLDIGQVLSLAPVDIVLFEQLVKLNAFRDEALPHAQKLLEFLEMTKQNLAAIIDEDKTANLFRAHPSFLDSLIELVKPSILEDRGISSNLRKYELEIFGQSRIPEDLNEAWKVGEWLRAKFATIGCW